MQFLKYYQLSTCLRYCSDVTVQFFEVEFDIVGAGLLNDTYANGSFHVLYLVFEWLSLLIYFVLDGKTPSGYCMVTQCKEPCCLMRARQSTPIIS